MTKTADGIRDEFVSDNSRSRRSPIKLQTDKGFRIIRLCDIDKSISPTGTEHHFIVRDPHGYEMEITVDIGERSVSEILRRSDGRLSLKSSFWIDCAERHLAEYLWQHEDYPPDARLTVDFLTPDDLDLALRCEGSEGAP